MQGLHFSDWASGKLFGRHRLAQTFRNNDVVPFQRFPTTTTTLPIPKSISTSGR